QMRRWGQIPEAKPDEWYYEMARQVYRPDIYHAAAEELIKEGRMKPEDLPKTDGYKSATAEFIDGIEFDARKPNEYLSKFTIGLKGDDTVK
ncbi:MAG: nitrate ABC transporter substrate-binding protein, partial [Gammaproteobacteria bacterium]|nr:nitrate ABC transporter substrate-binding protein [Gammaproteobacteria bacterium]